MINLSEAPKIVGAVFAIVLGVMLVTSGLTLEQLKAPWRYFLNLSSATQTIVLYITVWSVMTLVTVFWLGW